MRKLRKGDVVLFPFPYTDLSNSKLRPCLVISNEMSEDILLSQITSKKVSGDLFSVHLNESDTEQGSLEIESYVRINMLFTANKNLVKKIICKVKKHKYKEIIEKLVKLVS
ncbi:hypothetical protein BVX95_01050 [archaeon D22]|nr:hypothetical protein BVX95_01050 [archaeon D22]